MTQTELAARAGLTPGCINHIELGRRSLAPQRARLSAVLNVTLVDAVPDVAEDLWAGRRWVVLGETAEDNWNAAVFDTEAEADAWASAGNEWLFDHGFYDGCVTAGWAERDAVDYDRDRNLRWVDRQGASYRVCAVVDGLIAV